MLAFKHILVPTDFSAPAERALDLSLHVLRPRGTFVVKLFMGAGFEQFRAECRKGFVTVKVVKPEASVARRSKELYLVCTGGKPVADG